jgi:tetratricopeptide (TPR) repeat protein
MANLKRENVFLFLSLLCCAQLCSHSTNLEVKAQSSANASKDKVTTLLRGGIEKHHQGDDSGAEKNFREALKLDAANVNAHYNLAALEEARGEVGAALSEYRQVLRYNPNDQSVISAIHELEASTDNHATIQEKTALKAHTQQDSLLPSQDAFATLPDFPPRAPARGGLNSTRFVSSTQMNNMRNPQSTNLALATERNSTGGSMHALRSFGASFIRASLTYGRPVDTCACPILRF